MTSYAAYYGLRSHEVRERDRRGVRDKAAVRDLEACVSQTEVQCV